MSLSQRANNATVDLKAESNQLTIFKNRQASTNFDRRSDLPRINERNFSWCENVDRQKNTAIRKSSHESFFNASATRCVSIDSPLSIRILINSETLEASQIDNVKKTADLVYSWEHNGHGRIASFYVVYFVEQSFRKHDFEQVNRLLSDVNVEWLTEWSMIALLRSSFSARSFLPAWQNLLTLVWEKLEHNGKNPEKLLRGLKR